MPLFDTPVAAPLDDCHTDGEEEEDNEDEEDAATADSLDGLVASVVDDSLGDDYASFASIRPTSAPLPPLSSPSAASSSSSALHHHLHQPSSWRLMDHHDASSGLAHLSLSSPTSPANGSTSSRLRTFDFADPAASAPSAPSSSTSPRFPAAATTSTGPPPHSPPLHPMHPANHNNPYRIFSSLEADAHLHSNSNNEDQLRRQIEDLQQRLLWQQQQQQSRPPPPPSSSSRQWPPTTTTAPAATPSLYPPAYAGSTTPATPLPLPVLLLAGDSAAPMETMQGHFLQLAREQNGCRYLQSRIAKEGALGAHLILLEVFPHLCELMTDPFANYMYQKLLDVASPEQRLAMLEQVRHNLLPASINLHGTRSVQKHIEVASAPSAHQERAILQRELGQHITRLSMDTNGNHVVQRMLQHLAATVDDSCDYVLEAVMRDLVTVSRHRHGCCVVQRCLDAARGAQRARLIDLIQLHSVQLMQDPFANYTVQYVLEMGLGHTIVQHVLGRIEQLSKQKFSSNVVERCILAASPSQLQSIADECEQCMGSLLRDAFANFVAQKLLDVATEEQSRKLVNSMRPHLLELNPSCSRRVVARAVKRLPDLANDDVIRQVLNGTTTSSPLPVPSPPPPPHHHHGRTRHHHHHHQQPRA